jgi:hypothetical protein
MIEVVQIQAHALAAWGLILFALGVAAAVPFLVRQDRRLQAARGRLAEAQQSADDYADLYDKAEAKIGRMLDHPAYYHAQRLLRPIQDAPGHLRVTTEVPRGHVR